MKRQLSKLERNKDRPSAYHRLIENNKLAEQRRSNDRRRAETRKAETEDEKSYKKWMEEQMDALMEEDSRLAIL